MLNSISVRRATSADIPAIVALVESVYRGENSKKGWTTEEHLLDGQRTDNAMVRELMKAPGHVFLLAESDGKVLASVLLERRETYAYIGMLSVNVEAQNLKLGRRMLDECEIFASREWNLNETRITVIEMRTELVAWYERRGYTRTGNVEGFHTDPRFGKPKVAYDDLHLIEMARPIELKRF